jgi:Sel1 repeat
MQALTAGLETGEADRDPQDGLITIDELFAYLVEKLNVLGSPQRPSMSIFGAMGGELVFAYNPQARAAVGSELPFDWIKQVERHLGREDYESAFKLTQKAAVRVDPRAEWSVGVLYSEGRGVVQDYLKAREWFQKAADVGDAMSMHNLGVFYADGLGVAQDYAKAREWYIFVPVEVRFNWTNTLPHENAIFWGLWDEGPY